MSKSVPLHVIIALLAGVRKSGEDTLTKGYQSFKKPDLFSGMDRIYTPIKDDGIVYPEESKVYSKKDKKFEIPGYSFDYMITTKWSTLRVCKKPFKLIELLVHVLLFQEMLK